MTNFELKPLTYYELRTQTSNLLWTLNSNLKPTMTNFGLNSKTLNLTKRLKFRSKNRQTINLQKSDKSWFYIVYKDQLQKQHSLFKLKKETDVLGNAKQQISAYCLIRKTLTWNIRYEPKKENIMKIKQAIKICSSVSVLNTPLPSNYLPLRLSALDPLLEPPHCWS